MNKPEHEPLDARAQRELDAIDAALAGDDVSAEHEPVARLGVALRETRARPSSTFTDALDARAARGFASARPRGAWLDVRRRGTAERTRERRARPLLLRPASAVAFALVVAIAVAVPLIRSAGTRHAT